MYLVRNCGFSGKIPCIFALLRVIKNHVRILRSLEKVIYISRI